MVYTLQDVLSITFDGFDFNIPDETIQLIQELSSQVGSPTYIKTPNFQKKEVGVNAAASTSSATQSKKNKRSNKAVEVVNDSDWENLRAFHATKIEQKIGVDAEIDMIRSYLNKMSDKNYTETRDRIINILDKFMDDDSNMMRVSVIVFDIASTNRFYSRLYADLYSELIQKYELMHQIFENSFEKFMELFSVVEYVDPDKDYDRFCKINKNNEMRKSLSAFFVNLCNNNILSKDRLVSLVHGMLVQIFCFIKEDSKKCEVDELTENIAILYNKSFMASSSEYLIDDMTIEESIHRLAGCKAKDYPSLSNKSIFKYMDL